MTMSTIYKIVILGSTGGGVLFHVLKHSFARDSIQEVVADRDCGLLSVARDFGLHQTGRRGRLRCFLRTRAHLLTRKTDGGRAANRPFALPVGGRWLHRRRPTGLPLLGRRALRQTVQRPRAHRANLPHLASLALAGDCTHRVTMPAQPAGHEDRRAQLRFRLHRRRAVLFPGARSVQWWLSDP